MKLNIAVICFGILAALFIFSRYISVIAQADLTTILMVTTYCLSPVILLTLILLFKKWKIATWLVAAAVAFYMVKHTIIYQYSKTRSNAFLVPDVLAEEKTLSVLDTVFILEMLCGITCLWFVYSGMRSRILKP